MWFGSPLDVCKCTVKSELGKPGFCNTSKQKWWTSSLLKNPDYEKWREAWVFCSNLYKEHWFSHQVTQMSLETQHIRTYCKHILNQSFRSGDSQSMLIIVHFPRQKTDPRTHTEECKVNARHDDSNKTQAWKYLHAHLHLQQLTRLQEHFYNTLLWVLDGSLKMMTSYIHLLTAGDQTTPYERFPSVFTLAATFSAHILNIWLLITRAISVQLLRSIISMLENTNLGSIFSNVYNQCWQWLSCFLF